MTQPTAITIPGSSVDSLPEDIRSRLLAVQEKSGVHPERLSDAGLSAG